MGGEKGVIVTLLINRFHECMCRIMYVCMLHVCPMMGYLERGEREGSRESAEQWDTTHDE